MSGRKEGCLPWMAGVHQLYVSALSVLLLLAFALMAAPVLAATAPVYVYGNLASAVGSTPYSQQISASGGSGGYAFRVTSGALPPGLTLSGTGALTGVPVKQGTFSFAVTATDTAGAAGSASFNLRVDAPIFTITPTVLPNAKGDVPYHVQLAVTGGSGNYTFRIPDLPGGFTVSSSGLISGTPTGYSYIGSVNVYVTDSNGFTQVFILALTVDPAVPGAADLQATTPFNTPVIVEMLPEYIFGDTRIYHGTARYIVVRQPAHGTVVTNFVAEATYTPASGFSGTDSFTYVIKDIGGTSQPATVTITVGGRSDPTKDTEVLGILQAQADSARRLAVGQIDNFQRRLETLHTGAATGDFSNSISFNSASARQNRDPMAGLRGRDDDWNRRFLVQPDAPTPGQAREADRKLGDWSVWTGGAVNFGKTLPGTSANGIDFTTSGISLGVDRAFGGKFALGAGIGYGHDSSDVGKHNSRSTVDAYSAAVYGSYRPMPLVYVDALVGYQKLSFDSRRYVTDSGNTVTGSRDGTQLFASLSVGYEHRMRDGMLISPYGRFDVARASLDGYDERGDDLYNLGYQRQTVKTSTGVLGMRASWLAQRDYGIWVPQLRVEYRHDFQGSSEASMRYLNWLDGPLYRATLGDRQSRNHTLVGAGVMLQTLRGLSLRMEYQNLLDNNTRDNQSIQLGVEKKFDP